MPKKQTKALVRQPASEAGVYLLRGQKVITDADLGKLYQVDTKVLNRAVQSNTARFPADFMFRMTAEEAESLRYQFGTSKAMRGGSRYLPLVFTVHGVVMPSSVLKSKRAVQTSILLLRAFGLTK